MFLGSMMAKAKRQDLGYYRIHGEELACKEIGQQRSNQEEPISKPTHFADQREHGPLRLDLSDLHLF